MRERGKEGAVTAERRSLGLIPSPVTNKNWANKNSNKEHITEQKTALLGEPRQCRGTRKR